MYPRTRTMLAIITSIGFATTGETVEAKDGPQRAANTAQPTSPGARLTDGEATIETVTTIDSVETRTMQRIAGDKLPKTMDPIVCSEHKHLTLTNLSITAEKGAAIHVTGTCHITLIQSHVSSKSGPAIIIEGKKAKVTLLQSTASGAKVAQWTVAVTVGKRAKLQAKASLFQGAVHTKRKRDFKHDKTTRLDIPEDELQLLAAQKTRKKKRKRRSKKRRSRKRRASKS